MSRIVTLSRRVLVGGMVLFLLGCGGGGNGGGSSPTAPTSSGTGNLTGTYAGTFTSSLGGGSGNIDATLTQSGNRLSGSVQLSGNPRLLFTSGTVSGTVEGTSVVFGVVSTSGVHRVNFQGTVSGTRISGTYSASNGDAGTWSITRT